MYSKKQAVATKKRVPPRPLNAIKQDEEDEFKTDREKQLEEQQFKTKWLNQKQNSNAQGATENARKKNFAATNGAFDEGDEDGELDEQDEGSDDYNLEEIKEKINDQNQQGANQDKIAEIIQKMLLKNKINSKNAFEVPIPKVLQTSHFNDEKGENTWTKLASTLEAETSIYGYRVDSVHQQTYKLMGGIKRTGREEENPEDEEDAAAAAGNTLTDTAGGEAVPASKGVGGNRNQRREPGEAHQETNTANLNTKEYDQDIIIDPLFQKTSAKFDEPGVFGLLQNKLEIDSNLRLMIDSEYDERVQKLVKKRIKNANSEMVDEREEQNVAVVNEANYPDTDSLKTKRNFLKKLQKKGICPQLQKFKQEVKKGDLQNIWNIGKRSLNRDSQPDVYDEILLNDQYDLDFQLEHILKDIEEEEEEPHIIIEEDQQQKHDKSNDQQYEKIEENDSSQMQEEEEVMEQHQELAEEYAFAEAGQEDSKQKIVANSSQKNQSSKKQDPQIEERNKNRLMFSNLQQKLDEIGRGKKGTLDGTLNLLDNYNAFGKRKGRKGKDQGNIEQEATTEANQINEKEVKNNAGFIDFNFGEELLDPDEVMMLPDLKKQGKKQKQKTDISKIDTSVKIEHRYLLKYNYDIQAERFSKGNIVDLQMHLEAFKRNADQQDEEIDKEYDFDDENELPFGEEDLLDDGEGARDGKEQGIEEEDAGGTGDDGIDALRKFISSKLKNDKDLKRRGKIPIQELQHILWKNLETHIPMIQSRNRRKNAQGMKFSEVLDLVPDMIGDDWMKKANVHTFFLAVLHLANKQVLKLDSEPFRGEEDDFSIFRCQ